MKKGKSYFLINLTKKGKKTVADSVADPDFYPSRIPDPKTSTKERGEKKNLLS
jgi:hypothetical protein